MKQKICITLVVLVFISLLGSFPAYAYDSIDKQLFNFDLYLSKNPDVYNAFGKNYDSVINHWLNNGISEGREGSSVFDARYYLNKYADLKAAFGQNYKAAYNHYKTHGIKEKRIAHPNSEFKSAPIITHTPTPKPPNTANLPQGLVTLKAVANNKFVSYQNETLVADKTSSDETTEFLFMDKGNGYVALQARKTAYYVSAENSGNGNLIANRSAINGWELFLLVKNQDGTITLQANANGKFVCAENAGSKPLIARSSSIGGWEKFIVTTIPSHTPTPIRTPAPTITPIKTTARTSTPSAIIKSYDELDKKIFDYDLYILKNPDVYKEYGNDYDKIIMHWLNHGIAEGRDGGSHEFDAKYYLSRYKDLRDAFKNDYKAAYNHYKTYGIKECRTAKIMTGAFLKNYGRQNTHQFMCQNTKDNENVNNKKSGEQNHTIYSRRSIINDIVKDGYNTINIYIINDTNYSSSHGGISSAAWVGIDPNKVLYNPSDKENWKKWLIECRKNGINPVIWLMASSIDPVDYFDYNDEQKVKALWESFETDVGSYIYNGKRLVTHYVLGLEADKYWTDPNQICSFAKIMKSDILKNDQNVSLGIHNMITYDTPANRSKLQTIFNCKYFDTIYYQYYGCYAPYEIDDTTYTIKMSETEQRETADEIVNTTKELVRDFPKKHIISTEYSFFGETEYAKNLGLRCVLEGGASGALSGYSNP